MKELKGDRILFNVIAYVFISFVALVCLLPFILVITGSISSQEDILKYGFAFLPKHITFEAYSMAFKKPQDVLRAYSVTSMATVIGTLVGLFITAMTGYVLSRKDFEWRNKFAFYFYFTTLFNGGLVPWYILCVRYLKFNDSFLALLLPFMLNVFYILVMKSFMNSVPSAISESGKIDGANDFRIFIELILPLSKPALATIGLFIALGYWNDFYTSYMFIEEQHLFSLQYYLYKIIIGAQVLSTLTSVPGKDGQLIPTESLKLAMTIITTGPILFLYPFVQRYFVSGLTIGSVKG